MFLFVRPSSAVSRYSHDFIRFNISQCPWRTRYGTFCKFAELRARPLRRWGGGGAPRLPRVILKKLRFFGGHKSNFARHNAWTAHPSSPFLRAFCVLLLVAFKNIELCSRVRPESATYICILARRQRMFLIVRTHSKWVWILGRHTHKWRSRRKRLGSSISSWAGRPVKWMKKINSRKSSSYPLQPPPPPPPSYAPMTSRCSVVVIQLRMWITSLWWQYMSNICGIARAVTLLIIDSQVSYWVNCQNSMRVRVDQSLPL